MVRDNGGLRNWGGVGMSEDFEADFDSCCPKCGHTVIHSRDCNNFCEDGYFDEADDDPINFMPGESHTVCRECNGTGIEVWCPACGANLSGIKLESEDDNYE